MSASAGPKKQARFHFYDQGQVFALPVDDTWAFGLISRVSKVSPSMFLGHFFPCLWSELPRIEQLPEVTPSDAIYISQVIKRETRDALGLSRLNHPAHNETGDHSEVPRQTTLIKWRLALWVAIVTLAPFPYLLGNELGGSA